MALPPQTKTGQEVFQPTVPGGMATARIWATEMERRDVLLDATKANQTSLTSEASQRQAADTALGVRIDEAETEIDAVRDLALTGAKPPLRSVRLLATANVTIASGLENGDTLDGETLVTGDRVALTGQSTGSQNGIYVVVASGAASRATDADTGPELEKATFFVDEGTHAAEQWAVQTPSITLGSTAIVIEKIRSASGFEPEIIDARGTFPVLVDRLDASDDAVEEAVEKVDAIRLETFLLPFGEYDDEPSVIHVDQNNLIFLRIDSAGINVNSGAVPTSRGTLYYLDDGVMMVADIDGERVFYDPAPLAFSGAVSIHQGNPVTAVDSPSLGAKTVVAASPDRRILMPYSNKLLACVFSSGQSNAAGATATPIPDGLAVSDFPEDALMFVGDTSKDVRMGLNVGTGGPDTLSGAALTDFGGLISRTGIPAASSTHGVTPMEGMAKRIMHDCNAAFGVRPKHLFATVAVSGTGYSGLKKGTTPHTNMMTAADRAMQIAAAKGWKVWFPAAPIIHGEADAANSGYEAALYEWQTDIETDLKARQVAIQGAAQAADIPLLLSQPSTFQSDATKLAVIAMRAAMETSPKIRIATPTYPFPFSSDLLHMTAVGQFIHGEYFAKAYMAFAWGRDWHPLCPIPGGITWAGGTTVRVPMRVPVAPLVLDDTLVDDPNGQYGFRCYDSGGQITINNVATDGNEVVLTLAATPGGSGRRVDYAWSGYGGTRIAGEGPRGCLRDSDTTSSLYDERPLHNYCIHFTENF